MAAIISGLPGIIFFLPGDSRLSIERGKFDEYFLKKFMVFR